MKGKFLIMALLAAAAALSAQSLRVTQVDTGALLAGGRIDAYVTLNGPEGDIIGAIDPEEFTASEAVSDGVRSLEILEVKEEAARETGIDFLLLVDNSGSMYEPFQDGKRRIDYARIALATFISSVSGSGDRVALGAFNTYLHPLARLGASAGEMTRSLERMEEPGKESAYTELYEALEQFLPELSSSTGRKAVIVLSDGENYPFSRFSGITHPIWGDKLSVPSEVIRRYREEEVTLYAVNFAETRDPSLARIAYETGGKVFEARSTTELTDVYAGIREAIRKEVRIRIRVPAAGTSERNLSVMYKDASDDTRYFAPLLFGAPGGIPWYVLVLVALTAAAGIAALHFFTLESPVKRPEIQAVGAGITVAIQDEVTIIGSALDAHMSLAGNRGIDQHHATIVHDAELGTYTLVSEQPVRLNNTLVKRRRLKPGDVIAIEDSTIVFDAPEEKR